MILLEGLAHISLGSSDLERSVTFYRDILGFELVDAAPEGDETVWDWAWFRNNTAQVMLNTMFEAPDRPEAPDLQRREVHSDTGLYFGFRDVDGIHDYLVSQGVTPDSLATAPYGMRQLYVKDPDGYVLCFQWPAAEEGTE